MRKYCSRLISHIKQACLLLVVRCQAPDEPPSHACKQTNTTMHTCEEDPSIKTIRIYIVLYCWNIKYTYLGRHIYCFLCFRHFPLLVLALLATKGAKSQIVWIFYYDKNFWEPLPFATMFQFHNTLLIFSI